MTQRPVSALRNFLKGEAGSGVLLMISAAIAMIMANLPGAAGHVYHGIFHMVTGPVLAPALGPMTIHLWVNDGLMAIFFLLVGLEIKREFVDGGLSTWERRRLPFIAAGAGMIAPALVYLAVTAGEPALARGWAIPAATDIAFAIGVLALLGSRAPASIKLFLTAVAIVDDMGAVAIIALAYSQGLDVMALAGAFVVLLVMFGMNRVGVRALAPYLIGFLLLWYLMLLSGVHATIAGVLAAITIPVNRTPGAPDAVDSPLHRLEHLIHPWSAYLIVPLFGFANAGITLNGEAIGALLSPLPIGVALGLLLGKQLGVFGSIWLAQKLGVAARPSGATWVQIYGMALLCGIGFTMSLFIGALAFPGQPLLVEEAKIGILGGSLLSALCGYAVLRFAPTPRSVARGAG